MSSVINVRLTNNDKFVVTDPDTGLEKFFNSAVFHEPLRFIVDSSVKEFLLEQFPGKTDWECTSEALERIQGICDFNCSSDELRW